MNDEAMKVLLPMMRRIMPELMAGELASVQPMSEEVGDSLFSLKVRDKPLRPRFGEIIHSFIEGWLIYDGNKHIPFEDFIQRFPDLNYEELNNHKDNGNWIKRLIKLREEMTCPVCSKGFLLQHFENNVAFSICDTCASEVTTPAQSRWNKEYLERKERMKRCEKENSSNNNER